MNEMYVDMCYYYKGSNNVRLNLVRKDDGIDLVTDYGETITTITSGYGLMRVLEDLYEGKDREFVCVGGVSCKVQEAEDKVSVVRCKDCKESEVCPNTLLWCNQIERLVPPKGYCHCGERREK